MFFCAWGLRTPSQGVVPSPTRSANEYSFGSVFSSQPPSVIRPPAVSEIDAPCRRATLRTRFAVAAWRAGNWRRGALARPTTGRPTEQQPVDEGRDAEVGERRHERGRDQRAAQGITEPA